jgi:hypothetical protein
MIKEKYISFSELKNWEKCPFYHKLSYIDRSLPRDKNHFLSFGTALHHVCEYHIYDDHEMQLEEFKKKFNEEVIKDELVVSEQEFAAYHEQAARLFVNILPVLKKTFGDDFSIVKAEYELYEPIDFFLLEPYKFKGFIDLVIKDSNGKTHLIDWKTTSWGWDLRKRTDKMITYQLALYKMFYAQKNDMKPEDIDIHFILLKRTAKPDSNVEVYTVPCGNKKIDNCKVFLKNALYNITKQMYIKKRTSCGICSIHKTEFCP